MADVIRVSLQHPQFALLLTLLVYQAAVFLYEKARRFPLLHPLLLATVAMVLVLQAVDMDYAAYYQRVEILQVCLGLVTVALAVPLYESLRHLRTLFWPLSLTLLLAVPFAIGLVCVLARVFDLDDVLSHSLLTKSVTTPIAMVLSEHVGGKAALAAAFVLVTGMCAPLLVPLFLKLWPSKHAAISGVAIGLSAHAIGTAKALEISRECGAFAALAMSLTGVLTALLLPWFF